MIAPEEGSGYPLLPRGPHGMGRDAVDAAHRRRLLRAVLETIASRGYDKTTVSDIVAAAHVSKTAFYKLFKDRDECFAAAHELAIATVDDRLVAATAQTDGTWRELLRASLTEYLAVLTEEPLVARTLHNETLGPGSASALRRRAVGLFVERMRRLHQLARFQDDDVGELDPRTFQFIVGGIDALIQNELRDHPQCGVQHLAPVLIGTVDAVFAGASRT